MSVNVWKLSVLESSLDLIIREMDKVDSVSEFTQNLRELNPTWADRYNFRRLELQARHIANRFATVAEKAEEANAHTNTQ